MNRCTTCPHWPRQGASGKHIVVDVECASELMIGKAHACHEQPQKPCIGHLEEIAHTEAGNAVSHGDVLKVTVNRDPLRSGGLPRSKHVAYTSPG